MNVAIALQYAHGLHSCGRQIFRSHEGVREGDSSLFISKLMAQFILISLEDRSVVLEHQNILSLILVLTQSCRRRTRPGLALASDAGGQQDCNSLVCCVGWRWW